jgi:hypothetical protein
LKPKAFKIEDIQRLSSFQNIYLSTYVPYFPSLKIVLSQHTLQKKEYNIKDIQRQERNSFQSSNYCIKDSFFADIYLRKQLKIQSTVAVNVKFGAT